MMVCDVKVAVRTVLEHWEGLGCADVRGPLM